MVEWLIGFGYVEEWLNSVRAFAFFQMIRHIRDIESLSLRRVLSSTDQPILPKRDTRSLADRLGYKVLLLPTTVRGLHAFDPWQILDEWRLSLSAKSWSVYPSGAVVQSVITAYHVKEVEADMQSWK